MAVMAICEAGRGKGMSKYRRKIKLFAKEEGKKGIVKTK
jgi:hypothetical protein